VSVGFFAASEMLKPHLRQITLGEKFLGFFENPAFFVSFDARTLLSGWQRGHLACRRYRGAEGFCQHVYSGITEQLAGGALGII